MTSKVERNKRAKELSLYEAAYELFVNKGFQSTSISAIAKKAGVGKGTFYLYFKDKYDLLERIVIRKSTEVLQRAYDAMLLRAPESKEEQLIYFIDEILLDLDREPLLLKLIHKNLSWALLKEAVYDYDDLSMVQTMFYQLYEKENMDEEELSYRLYLVIELTGSVAYNAIVHQEPSSLSEIKPLLLESIRKMME